MTIVATGTERPVFTRMVAGPKAEVAHNIARASRSGIVVLVRQQRCYRLDFAFRRVAQ